jgi:hypothetical protein
MRRSFRAGRIESCRASSARWALAEARRSTATGDHVGGRRRGANLRGPKALEMEVDAGVHQLPRALVPQARLLWLGGDRRRDLGKLVRIVGRGQREGRAGQRITTAAYS